MGNKPIGSELSIIVPCGSSQSSFSNLLKWIPDAMANKVEVILVVDTDDIKSQKKIQSLRNLRQGIRVVSSSSRNPGGARNIGFQNTNRKWVMFCDSDDILYVDNALAVLEETIQRNKRIGIGQFVKVAESEQNKKKFFPAQYQETLMDLSIAPGIWRYIFLRERIENVKFLDLSMGEDQVFLACINMTKKETHFSNVIIYEYFIDQGDQLTNQPALINDLPKAIKFLSYDLVNPSEFSKQVLVRFLITGVKKARKSNKLYFLIKLIALQFNSRVSILKNMFLACKYHFSFKRRNKKFIEVVLTGGLGNQLFQVAYALNLARTSRVILNTNLGSPRLNNYSLPEVMTIRDVYTLNKITGPSSKIRGRLLNYSLRSNLIFGKHKFLRVLSSLICSILYSVFSLKRTNLRSPSDLGWDPNILNTPKSSLVIGYFQSFVFASPTQVFKFMHNFDVLNPSQEYLRLKKIIGRERPLIVHIRLGDYKKYVRFGTLERSYYEIAVRKAVKMKKYTTIWLFSDETELAIKILDFNKDLKVRVISESTLNPTETFQLMRQGSGYILGNSSFSWWAAYLRMKSNVPVFAPTPWFKAIPQPHRLFPDDWHRIKSAFK
jgi:glycosyltransferase involved in cell wall biosynthesis